jgi:hypothetical protein
MKQKQLIIGFVAAFVVVNGIGFFVFKKSRDVSPPLAPIATAPAPAPAPVDQELVERTQNARARRAAGVSALEAGDYEKALINFTEAQALIGENAKVTELLKITEDLRDRAKEKKDEASPSPAKAEVVTPLRPSPVRPSPRPVAAAPRPAPERPEKTEPRPTDAPAPIVTGTGMLLVSTTPRGLLVQVDGSPLDLTPMRIPVKVGTRRVALYDGDRRVFETSVEVFEGQVATVLKDLSAELAPRVAAAETRTERSDARTEPEPVKRPEPVGSKTAPAPAPIAPAPAPVPSTPAPIAPATGGLQISSPGVYGEIWVNGRPYGFTPVTVNGLTPGNVKVEVRVNGAVRRSSSFLVEAGQVKPIRVVK